MERSENPPLKPAAGRHWRVLGSMSCLLLLGVLTSCVAAPETWEEPPEPAPTDRVTPPEMVPEQVSDRVLDQAAADLQAEPGELSTRRFNQEVWSDGCLGLGQPDELCLQALVEGWQLEVVHNEQSHFYRSDNYGDVIRRSALDHNLPPSIEQKLIDIAASDYSIPAHELQVTAAEPRLWDGCMGIVEPGIACTQIAILGWRAVVAGNGQTLVYHTDMTGDDIRLSPQ